MQRRIDAQQHGSGYAGATAEHKIAEILVPGQQQPILRLRHFKDCCVARRRRNFRRVHDVMPRRAQAHHKPGVHALVDEPAHG